MSKSFARAVEGLLEALDGSPQPTHPPGHDISSGHREWFAQFAVESVVPLFEDAVAALEKEGASGHARLIDHDGDVAAELVIMPRQLIEAASPPRLTIAPAARPGAVMIEYGGSFAPGTEGYSAVEPHYCDIVYPSQVEEQILRFVRLAIGLTPAAGR